MDPALAGSIPTDSAPNPPLVVSYPSWQPGCLGEIHGFAPHPREWYAVYRRLKLPLWIILGALDAICQ
jgi:hypothetical protein